MTRLTLSVVLAVMMAAGCGSSPRQGADTVTVLAAASLTAAFDDMKTQFEKSHPGVTVKITYDGSAVLAQQIINGASADVFASADQATMSKVVAAGLTDSVPQVFARNRLEIVVWPTNPKNVVRLADLARPGVVVVTCAESVPCGAAIKKIEQSSRIAVHPVSQETAVTGVLSKVETGEADAGVVYVTDVNSAGGRVLGIPFPEADMAVNDYPIAVLKNTRRSTAAAQFVDFVQGVFGRQALDRVGFQTP
ncbi:MAG: molybdate ABC transporter substrate-binding protein [Kutzneria sp.]|nr:molybdate ABC transporter substrate-binding protein [Kutzneria sp.]